MHGRNYCPAGFLVSQCRCAGNHKNVHQVPCPPSHDHTKVPHLDHVSREDTGHGQE
jgi:hypothetical protein